MTVVLVPLLLTNPFKVAPVRLIADAALEVTVGAVHGPLPKIVKLLTAAQLGWLIL